MSRRTPTALLALLLAAAPRLTQAAQAPAGYEAPVLKDSLDVIYPPALLALPEPPGGRIELKYVVGVDGAPREIEVVRGVHPDLDAAAVLALAGLRYQPGLVRGRPVEVILALTVDIPAPARSDSSVAPVPSDSPESEPAQPTPVEPPISAPIRLRGRILSAGQRVPIADASVLVVPAAADEPVGRVRKRRYGDDPTPAWTMRAVTDAAGGFTLRGVPTGKLRIVVLVQGYERLEYVERLAADDELTLAYYPVPLVFNPYKTIVKSRRDDSGEVDRRTITPEEISKLPGTQGDALKSLQNFPGVARAPFGAGLLVIRGAAPSDSATFLGYHEIPQLFHFGGLTSVFNADILTQIDFIPGNFDSRFGDAIGGIINVNPRKGRRDGFHGYVDADIFDAGLLFEGPVGKGSFALSGRRSYIDGVLKVAVPKDAGLGLTQAPRYYDYQALFDYPVGGGELSIRWFGSDDRFKLIATPPNDTADTGSNSAQTAILFHRFDVIYRKQTGPWDFLITPSFNYQKLSGRFGNLFSFDFPNTGFSFRAEAARQISQQFALRLGTELQAGRYTIDARAPSFPAAAGLGGTGVFNVGDTAQSYATPAVYATGTIQLGERFTLLPGVRAAYYALQVKKATVDPRLRFMWQVAEQTTIKGGVGLYSQIPDLISLNPIWGNPRASVERSVHTSLGVLQTFENLGLSLEVTGFYKYVFDRSTASSRIIRAPDDTLRLENFANQGIGQIFGGEFLLRKALTKKFFGWISYTLMRSLIKPEPGADYKLFNFDQPHILTLIAVYKLPKNWQVGGRFRLVSGNPTTLYSDSVFHADTGEYQPVSGTAGRLPTFHQLDLRVDKTFVFKRVMMNVYLDVINVYNRQNGEAIVYSFNLQDNQVQAGLPIIPSLGMRLEF